MPSAKRILLVNSDPVPRRSLAEQLAREGAYAVIEAGSATEARAAQEYQFAILDGPAALAADLRGQGFGGPILFLTDDETGALPGERLIKPFRLSALLARLAADLGRAGDGEAIKIGPYLLKPGAKLLTGADARKIRLTEKETNILQFLHQTGGTVPRQTLLNEVWGYSPAVTTHTLETHIYRLRRKIEENPGRAKILLTVEGGYKLGPATV